MLISLTKQILIILLILDEIDKVTNQHLPLRKLTKKETKTRSKPWITLGICKSIHRRNCIYRRFIKENKLESDYKTLRNNISTLCKESKKLHFTKFFNQNSLNLKKTWSGIRELINTKNKKSLNPTCLSIDNKTIFDGKEMANSFDKFFTSIAGKLKKKIFNKDHADFQMYLNNPNLNFYFINPSNQGEIIEIISSLDNSKALEPSSIPYKILYLIKRSFSAVLPSLKNTFQQKN